MKRLSLLLVLAALLTLVVAVPPPASANPWPNVPAGYRIGKTFQVVARDTLWFTKSDPAGGGAGVNWYGPQVMKVYDPKLRDYVNVSKRAEGVMLGATKPFRLRAYWAGGMSTGTTQVPVDTIPGVSGAGWFRTAYPCVFTGLGMLDSLRLTPGASDTVWGALLFKDN